MPQELWDKALCTIRLLNTYIIFNLYVCQAKKNAVYIPATSLWISPRAKLNIKHENPGCFLSSRVSMFYINGHHGRHHHHNLSRPD